MSVTEVKYHFSCTSHSHRKKLHTYREKTSLSPRKNSHSPKKIHTHPVSGGPVDSGHPSVSLVALFTRWTFLAFYHNNWWGLRTLLGSWLSCRASISWLSVLTLGMKAFESLCNGCLVAHLYVKTPFEELLTELMKYCNVKCAMLSTLVPMATKYFSVACRVELVDN